MANYLILNQNQVFNGLGTLTYSVPAGTVTQRYTVSVQVTFPESLPINSNISHNSAGLGGNNPPGMDQLGAGSGAGLGSGVGGGDQGFVNGDRGTGAVGTGKGGVGQGFGTANNYPQPSSQGSNVTANSYVASSLSIVVNKNAVAQYTSTAPTQTQSGLQFKVNFSAAASDSITVVLTGNATTDAALNGLTSNVSVMQGIYQ